MTDLKIAKIKTEAYDEAYKLVRKDIRAMLERKGVISKGRGIHWPAVLESFMKKRAEYKDML